MFKNGILSIVFATLLICGFIPHANAATFTLNSIAITDFDEGGGDNALNIVTDSSPYLSTPYTTNLSVGEATNPFPLFDIWKTENSVNPTDDIVEKPITVDFSFSMPIAATGGPITGKTFGSTRWDVAVSTPLGDYYDWIDDQGNVTWDSSADFNFGNGGIFRITLSEEAFNHSINSGYGGTGIELAPGQLWGSTVNATLFYVQAPTAVPVPPAIILLSTGIVGIAGIRRKFKK